MAKVLYERDGRIARITLNRPEVMNAIDDELPGALADAVARADNDPGAHVIVLAGAGRAFCAGYDLTAYASGDSANRYTQEMPWDPMKDYAGMSDNTDKFMSLFRSRRPVICKVHGFAVAGGSDIALCSDMIVMAEDARIGYPPVRVWGCPTTAMWVYRLGAEKAKRMLFTGDKITGIEAAALGLVLKAVPADRLDDEVDALAHRISTVPQNQLMMQKLMVNQALYNMGLMGTQMIATVFDGITRHSPEGLNFKRRSEEMGWKRASTNATRAPSTGPPISRSRRTGNLRSALSRPSGPIADFATVGGWLPWPELGSMRRLGGQADGVEPVGLAVDLDLQLPACGAEGEFDVACDHRPVAVLAKLVEAWLARHAVDVGLQFDRYVAGRIRQCRSGGEADLEDEKRIGRIWIEPGRRRRDGVNIVGRAGRHAERDDNAKCLQAVTEKCAGVFCAAQAHRQRRAEDETRDRTERRQHQQRQHARHDGVGAVSEADQLQYQQCGDKAQDRTNDPAGDLRRILHISLDHQSQAGSQPGSLHLTAPAGNSFTTFEA